MFEFNHTALTYADLKGTKHAELVKNYAREVMKDAPADTKMPVPASRHRLLKGATIPKEIAELVAKEKNDILFVPNEVGALVYDTWKHLDDDVNDLYTYRIETLYGVKNITYKNDHPTVAQLETIDSGFAEYYQNELNEGVPENTVVNLIAMEVADYVLGEDFRIFFNENLDLLHKDMREDFLADARRILAELKTSAQ